jgi:agmatine deiminase
MINDHLQETNLESEAVPDLPPAPPGARGYRLPAEWEPHDSTWLAWPHNDEDWPGKFEPIPWVFSEIVRHLAAAEPVNLLVRGNRGLAEAREFLERAHADLANVRFLKAAYDRGWMRDCGPFWVIRDESSGIEAWPRSLLLDFRFNAWAKYDNWRRDNRLPKRIAQHLGQKRIKPPALINGVARRVVLEGGSIDVNGRGTLLTTEECLLSPIQERNPGLDRAGYEQVFRDYFGVQHVIWLSRGIVGDDTHGHIDDLARFVDATTVVAVIEQDRSSPNFAALDDNRERLRAATDQDGHPLKVVELPMPSPVHFDGQTLPASYANFLIANGLVLVPTFNDPADRQALGILANLFPGRKVVGIHSVDLVWGLGTIHCLTRDQPRLEPDLPFSGN